MRFPSIRQRLAQRSHPRATSAAHSACASGPSTEISRRLQISFSVARNPPLDSAQPVSYDIITASIATCQMIDLEPYRLCRIIVNFFGLSGLPGCLCTDYRTGKSHRPGPTVKGLSQALRHSGYRQERPPEGTTAMGLLP